jgi:HemY protein
MVAVAAGDADAARRFAREADGLLDEPPLTMLLSAQAAQLNGDEGAARRYFEAMLKRPETEFLGLRGLLNTALRHDDRAEALALVERARAISPRTPWVLRSCLELQVAQRRWGEAEATLAEALKAGIWDAETGRRFRTAILVEASRMAEADGRPNDALTMAHKAVGLMPGFVPAVAREARLLARAGRHKQALRLIEKSWPRSPHAELAQIFREGEPASADPLEGVRHMERLLRLSPEHPESLIAMAEVELRARLWGAARTHLLKAEQVAPDRRVYRLLAELEAAEHDDGAAARAWLAKAAAAPPDAVWACASCGAPAQVWSALCPACDAFDTLSWRPPTTAIHLPATTAVLHPAADARLPAVR